MDWFYISAKEKMGTITNQTPWALDGLGEPGVAVGRESEKEQLSLVI